MLSNPLATIGRDQMSSHHLRTEQLIPSNLALKPGP